MSENQQYNDYLKRIFAATNKTTVVKTVFDSGTVYGLDKDDQVAIMMSEETFERLRLQTDEPSV